MASNVDYSYDSYLLKEDGSKLLQEDGDGILLNPQGYGVEITESLSWTESASVIISIIVQESLTSKEKIETIWSFAISVIDSISLTENYLVDIFVEIIESVKSNDTYNSLANYFVTVKDKVSSIGSYFGDWLPFVDKSDDPSWTSVDKNSASWKYKDKNDNQTKL